MRKFLAAGIFAISMASTPAQASSMNIALQLGTLLASEGYCDLKYNHSAIQAFIEKNVDASDMKFASNLDLMRNGKEFENQSRSDSAKIAHCAQIARSAKAQGFIQ